MRIIQACSLIQYEEVASSQNHYFARGHPRSFTVTSISLIAWVVGYGWLSHWVGSMIMLLFGGLEMQLPLEGWRALSLRLVPSDLKWQLRAASANDCKKASDAANYYSLPSAIDATSLIQNYSASACAKNSECLTEMLIGRLLGFAWVSLERWATLGLFGP